ncbi:hypothetical protein HYX18_02145 [Candidatus Woesearchaeota archaeon]|nr:hypothetical protein [Candidatus Woesearchaeota archaeon]
MNTDTITIPKTEYEQMKQELKTLRNIKIYQRLLEFENNIAKGQKFTRKDLGF